jgi:uncharacterized membrane protein
MAEPDAVGGVGPTRFSRADTGRVEAFSDGVFAIAVTILVLEIHDPGHADGGLARALLGQWPAYLGYVSSFVYIGVIWVNHHQAFARIRLVDRGLNAANLLLLGTTAALAFPTGVVSDTLRESSTGADARTAIVLYALVAAVMCGSWLLLYTHLRRHPLLLDPQVEPEYVCHGQARSAMGVGAYAVAGVIGYFVTPLAGLALIVVLPCFYFATSEGFHRPPALPGKPGGRS